MLAEELGMPRMLPKDIEGILSGVERVGHALHLYTPNVNKYTIQRPFLAATKVGEEAVYVTAENPKNVTLEFEGLGIKLSIIKPEDMAKLGKRKLRMVVDAGSIDQAMLKKANTNASKYIDHLEREKYLDGIGKTNAILCTYDTSKLDSETIKQLTMHHDNRVLTTSDVTVRAAVSVEELGVSGEVVERFVKDDLELIVLSLIANAPMCGTDIIRTVHRHFNVLVSPGTIYPLLHELEEKKLLKCEEKVKMKIYRLVDGSEEKVRKILSEHARAKEFMSRFLRLGG